MMNVVPKKVRGFFMPNPPDTMNVIIQEEVTGCGIAAVANVVQRPYAEVKARANAMGIFAEDERLYCETGYVRRLLKAYGIQSEQGEVPFVAWENLPDFALLAIKHHQIKGINYWHWVVFKRMDDLPFVLDSSPDATDNLRTDVVNMRPAWFIKLLN